MSAFRHKNEEEEENIEYVNKITYELFNYLT